MLTGVSSFKSHISDKEYERYWEAFWQDMSAGFALGQDASEFVVEAIPALRRNGTKLVLDVGCGDGRNYVFLQRSGFKTVGLDISSRALGLLRKNAGSFRISVLASRGRIQSLPFEAETFDAVIASDLFNHLIRWDKAIAECQRVLKDGGYLICNPLSLRDSLFGKGEVLAENVFFLQDRLMHFSSFEEIQRSFIAGKLHIRRCVEGIRNDPPHPKFIDTRHAHVFWNVWARKLRCAEPRL